MERCWRRLAAGGWHRLHNRKTEKLLEKGGHQTLHICFKGVTYRHAEASLLPQFKRPGPTATGWPSKTDTATCSQHVFCIRKTHQVCVCTLWRLACEQRESARRALSVCIETRAQRLARAVGAHARSACATCPLRYKSTVLSHATAFSCCWFACCFCQFQTHHNTQPSQHALSEQQQPHHAAAAPTQKLYAQQNSHWLSSSQQDLLAHCVASSAHQSRQAAADTTRSACCCVEGCCSSSYTCSAGGGQQDNPQQLSRPRSAAVEDMYE